MPVSLPEACDLDSEGIVAKPLYGQMTKHGNNSQDLYIDLLTPFIWTHASSLLLKQFICPVFTERSTTSATAQKQRVS